MRLIEVPIAVVVGLVVGMAVRGAFVTVAEWNDWPIEEECSPQLVGDACRCYGTGATCTAAQLKRFEKSHEWIHRNDCIPFIANDGRCHCGGVGSTNRMCPP